MRLIDADKLELNCIYTSTLEKADTVYQYSYSEQQIEKAPTVEAIPVDWLEEKAKMYDDLAEYAKKQMWGEIYSEWAQLLREMVVKWRKENETR